MLRDLAIFVTIYAFASYSAGQLVGQVIRSPIVSAFLACVFSGLLSSCIACLDALHVPIGFQVAPTLILLAASWLRSRDWLEERNTVAAWSRFAASVLIPFAVLYGSIGWYRLSSLPKVARTAPTKDETRAIGL